MRGDGAEWMPLMVRIRGRRVVAVGGGPAAWRKLERFLEAQAAVTVVSPVLSAELSAAVQSGRVRWVERAYRDGDLAEAELAIAATGTPADEAVREEAERRGVWLLDSAGGGGDVMLPAVVRRGRLVLTVSTLGASPGASARLVRELADTLAADWPDVLDTLAAWRQAVLAEVGPGDRRRRLLRAFDAAAARRLIAEVGEANLPVSALMMRMRERLAEDSEAVLAELEREKEQAVKRISGHSSSDKN